ncbi:M15 family metallopeptidase [Hymenobacter sp. M29]|uniref:M15 family metallopeptidase n=1 Tax=Hymenobacter mellowenesis TaxID=3063995 RepID=A0ABT9ACR3_9BACT|nr:M15 family metallopeptidase [Hymenobacter sp. M29]MDO7847648.1 M15 family metallopeptidase [Hymenobacter sp. M29]
MAALDTTSCLWYYGDPNSKEFQAKHMVLYVFPDWVAKIFPPYQHQAVRKQWVNKDLITPLEAVFKELLETGLWKELKTFDGLWNIRNKRGLNELSIHSWAIALDLNALTNPLGGKVTFSQAFLNVWRKHGFVCGADFGAGRSDGMHYQFDKVAKTAYAKHLASQVVSQTPPKPVAKVVPKKVEMKVPAPTSLPKTLPTK